jgi:serine/threonine-protein kinase RsbW
MADHVSEMLTLPAALEGIDDVRRWCAAHAQDAGVDGDSLFEFELAMTEALSNTIRHSYAEDAEQQIELSLSVDHERIEFVIIDRGIPFLGPEPPLPEIEQLGEGGYGLRLIAELTDELRREPCPDGSTRVTLIKYRKPR